MSIFDGSEEPPKTPVKTNALFTKKIAVLSLTVILLWSCKEENVNTISLGLDVQSSFSQDNVQITIDAKEIVLGAIAGYSLTLGFALEKIIVNTLRKKNAIHFL